MCARSIVPQKTNIHHPNRREFLKSSAIAGALSVFGILPRTSRADQSPPPPSERLLLGCIGMGSMGTGNMRDFLNFPEVQIVAVCDVDRSRREAAQAMVNEYYGTKDCRGYNDFRELLEKEELNLVSIALPDHWHAIPAIAAARKGLDIYGEKPLALTIPQGRAMVNAVHRHGVIWQTGSWQRSQTNFWKACTLVRNGRIGTVSRVEVGLPTGPRCEPQPEMPIPEGFDYDMWLGPAPYAPYTEKRCHWNFRWILDYSGGQLTDWAAHHCDIANWGMGTEYAGPTEVIPIAADYPKDGLWNAAVDYHFECKFPAGVSPVAPDGFVMSVSNKHRGGAKFIGTDGWVWVDRGGFETDPPQLKDSEIGSNEIILYKTDNHKRNFLDCVRTRKETITPIEPAHRAITIAHLGNIAMQLNRAVRWDPVHEKILDDPEAQRKLDRSMRAPWHI